tara:strand:- start:422 stop:646 length:225 start_codon:yes stop_codon:yes gene_type:complete
MTFEKMGKADSIEMNCVDGILTLKIDTNTDIGPSASGKTIMIASSGGNKKINVGDEASGDDFVMLGLNLYRYPE